VILISNRDLPIIPFIALLVDSALGK
jgi:hypothetical protein